MAFDFTADEGRLLLNIALMAVGRNRFRSAAQILAALERYRPDSPQIAVSKAIALMSACAYAEGLEFMENVALRKFPGNPMILAFKGMALIRLDRRDEAREALREAAGQEKDDAARRLAEKLMEGIEK